MYTDLKILLQFVSSDLQMLEILRRYTRLHKTTQPVVEACLGHAHRVLPYRESIMIFGAGCWCGTVSASSQHLLPWSYVQSAVIECDHIGHKRYRPQKDNISHNRKPYWPHKKSISATDHYVEFIMPIY